MAAKWKRSDEMVWEELGDKILVVSSRSGARWSLNAVASAIWKLCDGSHSADELAGALGKVSGRGLRAEITALCDSLAVTGLLHPATGAGSSIPAVARVSASFNPAPAFRLLGLASGPRRRPSPRGNSGPG